MRYTISAKELWLHTSRLVKTRLLWHWKSAFKWEWISFADIREYIRWDPWKRIDRRTTAKKWALYIKEYEEERQLTVLVWMDMWKSMNFTLWWRNKKDQAISILSILSYATASYWDKLWWVLFAADCIRKAPKKWMRPYFSLMKEYTTTNNTSESSVTNLVACFLHRKVRHSLLFIICDDFVENIPWLRALSHYNDVVFLHCFDEFEMTMNHKTNPDHWLLWQWKKMRSLRLWWSVKEQYKKNFEEKRAATESYVVKQWCSYRSMSTSDDPVVSLAKFFMKKAHSRQ